MYLTVTPTFRMTTPLLEIPYFPVEGVTLPKELRDSLVERGARHDYAPDLTITVNEITKNSKSVEAHPANEGIRYNWVGIHPFSENAEEMEEYNADLAVVHALFTPTAQRRIVYYIVGSCEPYGGMSPHMDSRTFSHHRRCVMFFPLSPYNAEEWATLKFYRPNGDILEVPFQPCYVGNTEAVHGYDNNEHYRYNLQVAFSCSISELHELHKEGKLIA